MRYVSAILATALLTLTAAATAARPEERREGVPVDGEQQTTAALDGTWTARYAGRKGEAPDRSRIHLQFHRDHNNMGHTWPAASLPGLNLDREASDIRVELRREAGTIVLTGNVRRGRGFGIFDFTPNADFARQIGASVGRKALTPERLFALAVHDVSRAYIQELEALGYKNLDLDDLLGMRIHGVTPEFIKELRALGFTTLSHDDLVAFRIHGATPDFVRRMEAAGYKGLDPDDLVSARIHGVSPEFLDEMKKHGYRDLDFDDLVSFRIHGVTPDFIEEMAAAGYKDLSAERLVEFRIHGVDAEFVKDLKEQGYSGLSSRELVEARIHGRRWMKRKGD
jgi:hypothetical protein